MDSSESGYGPGAESCEHGDEPSGSVNGVDLLTSWATKEELCSSELIS
jgi:hypothetical protein